MFLQFLPPVFDGAASECGWNYIKLEVAGSNPARRKSVVQRKNARTFRHFVTHAVEGRLAQPEAAPALQAGGPWFDPRNAYGESSGLRIPSFVDGRLAQLVRVPVL